MSPPRDATLRSFLSATRELRDALEREDLGGLAEQASRQLECFQALQAETTRMDLSSSPELAECIHAAEEALSLSRARLTGARREIEQIREARSRAARPKRNEPTARFISQRV